jgi:hypothetical protein
MFWHLVHAGLMRRYDFVCSGILIEEGGSRSPEEFRNLAFGQHEYGISVIVFCSESTQGHDNLLIARDDMLPDGLELITRIIQHGVTMKTCTQWSLV